MKIKRTPGPGDFCAFSTSYRDVIQAETKRLQDIESLSRKVKDSIIVDCDQFGGCYSCKKPLERLVSYCRNPDCDRHKWREALKQ